MRTLVRKYFIIIVPKIFYFFIRFIPTFIRVLLVEKLPVIKTTQSPFPEHKTEIKHCCRSRLDVARHRSTWTVELETIGWINEYFEGGVLFDVGANVGNVSLIAAKLGKAGKVFSFESSYMTFLSLCENVRVNSLEDVITPCNIAMAGTNGMIKFYYHDLISGGSLHSLGANIDYSGKSFKATLALPMPSMTVDRFIECFNIPCPNYIKIDVDGTELEIMNGMKKTLANLELKTVLVEVSKHQDDVFIEMLRSFGFQLSADFMQRYGVQRHAPTGCIDLIFERGVHKQ